MRSLWKGSRPLKWPGETHGCQRFASVVAQTGHDRGGDPEQAIRKKALPFLSRDYLNFSIRLVTTSHIESSATRVENNYISLILKRGATVERRDRRGPTHQYDFNRSTSK